MSNSEPIVPSSAEILMADPGAVFAKSEAEIVEAVSRVLARGWFVLGPEVTAFETEFAEYCQVPHGIGVANGTDAVALALRACGIERGDRVATVSHTAVATVVGVEMAGGVPVLLDVDPDTYTLCPQSLADAAERGLREGRPLKAVVPVHLYGHPADMPEILRIAEHYRLMVVEDCAQAHGAMIGGKKIGSWGQAAAFSFYPTKNLGAAGDGGMVTTSTAEIAKNLRLLRQYGWKDRYISTIRGVNSRLDEIQAAILRVILTRLDALNERRRQIADDYSKRFRKLPDLKLPEEREGFMHVFHQYTIRTPRRDDLLKALSAGGIRAGILYPQPIHEQPAYAEICDIGAADLRSTRTIAPQILSLPIHPSLSEASCEEVVNAVIEFFDAGSASPD